MSNEAGGTRRRQRAPLDRSRVVDVAVALADGDGLGALSMRRLAEALDVVPMALYKHVADKDDLVAGMIDRVVSGYPEPPPDGDWRSRVRERLLDARAALLAHPWLRTAIEGSTRRTAAVLLYMDAVAGELIRGGLSADLAHYALHALGHRLWGFSPEAFDDRSTPPAPQQAAELAAALTDRLPYVMAITRDSLERTGGRGCDSDYEFAFTLDLLLDAFDRLNQAGWTSSPAGSTR